MSLHFSLFKPLPWSSSSSRPDDEPHLLVQNALAKIFSYVISTKDFAKLNWCDYLDIIYGEMYASLYCL